MAIDNLTAILAERVMGWGVGPDRYLTSKRGWMPRWRFQPTENVDDAFRLLEKAKPEAYTMGSGGGGFFWAKVRISGVTGEAHESSQARAIVFAITRALGLEA